MPTLTEQGKSYRIYEAGVSDTDFTIGFPYIDKSHIRVNVNDVAQVQDTAFIVNTVSNEVEFQGGYEPSEDDLIKIFRSTPIDNLIRQFSSGTVLTSNNLTIQNQQFLYALQEFYDIRSGGTSLPPPGSVGDNNPTQIDGGGSDPTIGGDYDEEDLMIFLNGQLVHPNDYTTTTVSGVTTVTLNITTTSADKIVILPRAGVSSVAIEVDSVTTGSIADGAVTNAKIADNTLRWNVLAEDGFNGSWSAVAGGTDEDAGVGALLLNLNTRVAALEASPIQIDDHEVTLAVSGTISHTFPFVPEYVLCILGEASGASAGSNSEMGGTFVVKKGDSAKGGRFEDGEGVNLLTFDSAALNSTTGAISISYTANAQSASARLTLLAIKF